MVDQRHEPPSPIPFEGVVCAVDPSPESREAARQAVALAVPGPKLWAVPVWDPGLAIHARIHASEVAAELREASAAALRDARKELPALEPILIRGSEVTAILAAIVNLEADLVAVGAHHRLRRGVRRSPGD